MILDEEIAREIRALHKRLDDEGKLLTRAQLAAHSDTFRKRFGPERLTSLDGDALLDAIHDLQSKDSLVYWLEYKDDDELPGVFGSIAGGSALKFIIYRRKETGTWMTGSPAGQKELSKAEAIEYARKHRDQLVRGAELLAMLPAHSGDPEYKTLQEEMDKVAPDVSRLAWGHKYFSLLYPDKLDDYHHTGYQRFHLIKMLQRPPAGDGRYVVAGRYVAIANELDMPVNSLTTILNHRNGRPHRYWRIGTSDGTKPRNRWAMMRDGNCVAIGWSKLGDLSEIRHNQASLDRLRAAMAEHYPGVPQAIGTSTKQVFQFVAVIAEGDLVLASDGGRVLGIGKVGGSYGFEPSSDFPHQRPVEWLSLEEWGMPKPDGLRTTVHTLDKYPANLIEVERHIFRGAPALQPLSSIEGRIQAALERKAQVILFGPPGTGKTFWAELTARELAARSRFGVPFAQLTAEQQPSVLGDGRNPGMVRMCCFHPAYGYEDFLEGYRPEQVDGRMVFSRRDGIFKTLCRDAEIDREHDFFLIIDEINRGDIPRIFGELLTIVEKNKRGKSILLPLSGEPFYVPPNVYIIGTMNTADRSIALLDTALRRRFGFIELMPDSSVLGDAVVASIPLGPWLDALNRRICEHVGRDARNLQIGHSYLFDGGHPVVEFPMFSKIVHEDLIPLLEEYCYEDYEALEKILGKGLVDSSRQTIRHELFDPSKQDELVLALLEPSREIVASPQAVASDVAASEEDGDDGEDGGASGSADD